MLRVCLAALICVSLVSCEDKQDDKVFSAQSCLDHATPATVDTCVAMINGIATTRAFIIRCAADFKRNGIDTSTIVQAVDDLDNPSGNVSASLLNKLVFRNGGTADTDRSDQAVADCSATGSQTLLALATAASTATFLQTIVGGSTDISTIDPNSMTQQQLIEAGEKALDLFPVACSDGGPFKGTKACDDMTSAALEAGVDLGKGSFTDAEKEALAKKYLAKI